MKAFSEKHLKRNTAQIYWNTENEGANLYDKWTANEELIGS